MPLTQLKYKTYTWPTNPRTYSIRFEKNTAIHHYPYTNVNEVEDTGMKPREVSGEGEFIGEGAYDEFKKLASIFYASGPGALIHPIWQIQQAVFQRLEVQQEPTPNYVKYLFSFIEHIPQVQVTQFEKGDFIQSETDTKIVTQQSTHIVKSGEYLSTIAKQYGTTWQDIADKNPSIKNPNIIYPGQKIIV